jgi:hypothetical protein
VGRPFRGIPQYGDPSGCQPAGAAKPCDFSRLRRAGLVAPDCIRATSVRPARSALRHAVNARSRTMQLDRKPARPIPERPQPRSRQSPCRWQRGLVHLFDLQMMAPLLAPNRTLCVADSTRSAISSRPESLHAAFAAFNALRNSARKVATVSGALSVSMAARRASLIAVW